MSDTEKTVTDQKVTAENGSTISGITQIGIQNISYPNAPQRAPIQVPSLTEDFVELPHVKREIKNRLLNGNNSKGILAITAIQGLGGIGKTTLAIIVANDEEVQKRFSDGILWATLGQEPEKLSLLNSWIQALGDYQSNHTTVQTASSHLRTLLYEKRILLVVDDAWDSREIQPFLVGGPNCQTIITTRRTYIADDLGVECYSLKVMTEDQSLELFKNVLKNCWNEDEKEEALKVAKDVGYLPLALNLAAKRRKRDHSWIELHKALNEEIARLSVLESPRRLRKGEEGLEASLNLSLKALRSCDEEAYEDFVWLGVLPEDIKVNERMTSTLWDLDKEEAGQILEILWDEGLLIQDLEIQFENEKLKTYRMHDLFHDIARHYLTFSLVTKKATDLPGLGFKLKEAHTSLLNRYKSQTQKKGSWHTLKDDAYIHSHLTWHMEKAGQAEEIHRLLREENENGENGWYEALESLRKSVVFVEDLLRARKLAEKESENHILVNKIAHSISLEVRYDLLNTSMNSLSSNISATLLTELLRSNKWTSAKALMYAQKEPGPFARVVKLITIIHEVNNNFVKNKVIEKAIDSAYKIQYNEEKIEALSLIIPYIDGSKKEEVLKEIQSYVSKILSEDINSHSFPFIIPYIDVNKKNELIKNALDAVLTMEDDQKLNSLTYIIPYLDGNEKEKITEEAFDCALNVLAGYLLGDRLGSPFSLIPLLNGDKKEELIKEIRDTISIVACDEFEKAGMISSILSYIDPREKSEVIEEILHLASGIEHKHEKGTVLSSIISHMEEGTKKDQVIEEALTCALNIHDEYEIVSVQCSIIPYVTNNNEKDKLVAKIRSNTSKIQDRLQRVKILSSILPYVEGNMKNEVIDTAIDYTSRTQAYGTMETLSLIIPYVKGSKKEETMEKILYYASNSWFNNSHGLYELSSVLPYFEGTQKDKLEKILLHRTLKIEVEQRVSILSSIIPFLREKEEIVRKVLDDVSKIKYDHLKIKYLSSILPYIQEKGDILDYESEIENEYYKAKLISSVIPHIEEKDYLIQKVLDYASKVEYLGQKISLITSVLPYIKSPEKEEITEKLLYDTLKIEDDYHQSKEIVVSIFPYLEESRKKEVVEEIFSDILTYGYYMNFTFLSAILQYIDKDKKEKILEKIYEGIWTHDKDRIAKILCLMIANLDESSLRCFYSGWKKIIEIISEYTRRDFLRYLQVTIPSIYKLGGYETLIEISSAIDDSSRWWP